MSLLFHWLGSDAEQYHTDLPEGLLIAAPVIDLTEAQSDE